MTPEQPHRARTDRIVPSAYKYSWQFDEAMDNEASAKALYEEQRGLRRTRAVIWLGIALLGALYMANTYFGWGLWIFHWLAMPPAYSHLVFWPLIIAYGWYFYRSYDPERLITSNLLCFGCGYSLKGLPVDEHHRGRCPECGRQYSLGEYVHPLHPEKYPLPIEGARERKDG